MLNQEIRNKFVESRKTQNTLAKSVYESVVTKMLVAEKSGKFEVPLSDDVVVSLIQKEVKEREETKSFYKAEDEKYVELQKQIDLLSTYLPKQLSEEEVINIIQKVKLTETNKGKVIGLVVKEVGNRFDKSKVANLVNKIF